MLLLYLSVTVWNLYPKLVVEQTVSSMARWDEYTRYNFLKWIAAELLKFPRQFQIFTVAEI